VVTRQKNKACPGDDDPVVADGVMVTAPASPAAPSPAPGGNGDNSMVRNSGITSIPGTVAVTVECLPGSTLHG
jgi:hypothetical protein